MKVGMVSTYPSPESAHVKHGGVASYTKNLVGSLLDNCEVAVFADKIPNTRNEWQEGGMVYRCWNKGVSYPFQIFKKLSNNRVDIVHVQHEYFLFGGGFSALVFPFMLCLLRLLKKPIIVTLHGVIPVHSIDKQFLRDNMITGSPFVLKWGVFIVTRLIAFFADGLIVHESFLKNVLTNEYCVSKKKVHVIRHGIEKPSEIIDANKAKEVLGVSGKKILLFFGYITGYKGVELLVEAFRLLERDEDFVLFIAGGEHPRLKHNPDYLEYIQCLRDKARNVSDRIIFTGFVSESAIPVYFSAADVVIFPYKVAMASSGPLSLAISYEKPVLISDVLAKSTEFKDLVFQLSAKDLANTIEIFFKNRAMYPKVLGYAKNRKMGCSWNITAKKTLHVYVLISK
jgi:glycosyltransferase involved in cell wall biosynthesis